MAWAEHIFASRQKKFQSFFYWKCRNGILMENDEWCFEFGFNPSFTGNAAMARHTRSELKPLQIVSILLLLEMPQWLVVLEIAFALLEMFQSFFYWKCRNGLEKSERLRRP